MTKFGKILKILCDEGVRFILIGGVAAVAHGAARLTQDIDVVYSRDAKNLDRLAKALAPYDPYPRGAPPGLPFIWDPQTLANGGNFTPAWHYTSSSVVVEGTKCSVNAILDTAGRRHRW